MNTSKIDFVIKPIFDQSANPQIWQDFARIEMLCRSVEYGYEKKDNEEQEKIDSHKRIWEQKQNIAFAAYDGAKMIAFAKAYSTEDKDEIYFSDLYVDPQYKGFGIGKRLLEQRERAAGLFYSYVSLLALNEKVASFFVKRGFTNYDNRYMKKDLPKHMVGVVPVFKPLSGLRAKMKVSYDKSIVKQCKNQPVFVYVTYTGEIDALAVRTPENKVHVWTNQNKRGMSEFYEKLLLDALSKTK